MLKRVIKVFQKVMQTFLLHNPSAVSALEAQLVTRGSSLAPFLVTTSDKCGN